MEVAVPTFHITVRGADREAMADLVRVHGGRVLPQALDESGAESRVDALADESTIQRLTDAGYRVEQHEDVDEAAREDLQQIGQGNRFAADLAATMRATGERQGAAAGVDPEKLPPRLLGHGDHHRGGHRGATGLLLGRRQSRRRPPGHRPGRGHSRVAVTSEHHRRWCNR
jgi:hypothetical protein